MKSFLKPIFSVSIFTLLIASCTKKLDLFPKNDITSETVYSTPDGYKKAFAKLYGSLALTGNSGPAGNGDVQGIDEGFSDFLRLFWKAQELSTDEAVIAWGDAGIQDFHNMNWSSNNPFLQGLYYRMFYQVTICNDFINQSSDDNLGKRGISGADADAIRGYRNEAKFLRAFQYWVAMDLFANPPFVTEDNKIGSDLPKQIKRADLFTYVETQLKTLETSLPVTNEYGRANRFAAKALLARMYLNAQTYTGSARYADALTYAKDVITNGGYNLWKGSPVDPAAYTQLMLADNNVFAGASGSEFIFTINYDGLKTQGYGGTTFLTHAAVGGSMNAAQYGLDGGWGGVRATKGLVNLFPDANGTADKRAQFYTSGQNVDIADQTQFVQGYAVTKYRNVKKDGTNGQSINFSDVDFPVFRLAEMYLIYAEAFLNSGGGDAATALSYINELRTRASAATITSGQLTKDFILDERGRELYWEGFRRTDLIRYKKFVESSYLWPWKGGVASGRGVESFRTIYPIPASDVSSNTNLVQNTGY
ncbi:MAG: RagB/SusD family nutrient uptake outer membrane protein [Sphingobacteriales bacterium]|nr:RagB/SusD family nutrient uptake outer membrane protein [Sphingobacteriales bacterium]